MSGGLSMRLMWCKARSSCLPLERSGATTGKGRGESFTFRTLSLRKAGSLTAVDHGGRGQDCTPGKNRSTSLLLYASISILNCLTLTNASPKSCNPSASSALYNPSKCRSAHLNVSSKTRFFSSGRGFPPEGALTRNSYTPGVVPNRKWMFFSERAAE